MSIRIGAAIAGVVVMAAVALIVGLSGGSSGPPTPRTVAADTDQAATARFGGALEDCTTRSEANFPGAFTSSRNLVVGPLALIGGAYTDASTVREFGGNKFPLLVRPATL